MKKIATLAVVVAAQAILAGVAVAPQLSARVAGDTYLLSVVPVDPIDPFRGAYVALGYPDLDLVGADGQSVTAMDDEEERGPLYVVLRKDGDVWVADDLRRDRPTGDTPYIACDDRDWAVECGIDSFFLPQDEAAAMEDVLREGAIAEVRIDGRGHAALIDVRAP